MTYTVSSGTLNASIPYHTIPADVGSYTGLIIPYHTVLSLATLGETCVEVKLNWIVLNHC